MAEAFTPSQVGQYLKGVMSRDGILSNIIIQGELSNCKKYPSGHIYFTMKDQEGSINCVMYASDAKALKTLPSHGAQLLATGRVSVFVKSGQYQLQCTKLTPVGQGDLNLAFEQLKDRLEEEGLFDEYHKKPLPFLPKRVALITSPAGAAVQDMMRNLKGRCPLTEVIVVPVHVQGEEAKGEIAGAIGWVNHHKLADLIIVGRGGGSLEDLWAFNEEIVARAIFQSNIPIISAVGHEPDITIADFVADRRAYTPTHGAEIAVPDAEALGEKLAQCRENLANAMKQRIESHRRQLDYMAQSSGFRDPRHHLREKAQILDYQRERLESAMSQILLGGRNRCGTLSAALHALSPLEVMGRGYAIPRTKQGKVLRSVEEVSVGDGVALSLKDGTLHCKAETIEKT